jgi:hypothetical protein
MEALGRWALVATPRDREFTTLPDPLATGKPATKLCCPQVKSVGGIADEDPTRLAIRRSRRTYREHSGGGPHARWKARAALREPRSQLDVVRASVKLLLILATIIIVAAVTGVIVSRTQRPPATARTTVATPFPVPLPVSASSSVASRSVS